MVRLWFSMLINFPDLCYLEEWDHCGKIRKTWLPFQLRCTSGFSSSCMPIRPVIAGVGLWASPRRTCSCLSPLHLEFCMCPPPLFCILLQYLIDSLWDLCAPFLFCVKMSVLLSSVALWQESLGSGGRVWVRVLCLSVPKLPQGSLWPLFLTQLGCSVRFWGVHLEPWAGGGNDCNF